VILKVFIQTSLHNAALMGNTRVASLLIEKGADVNARDKDQETPVMIAEKKHSEIAAMIRAQGGQLYCRSRAL